MSEKFIKNFFILKSDWCDEWRKMKKSRKNAVGYVYALAEVRHVNESVEGQRKSIENFCRHKKYNLLAIYQDECIPGTMHLTERPAGRLLLKSASHGDFETIIWFLFGNPKFPSLIEADIKDINLGTTLERLAQETKAIP